MRAAVVHERGAVPMLEKLDEPRPAAGQTLLELGSAALNPVDLSIVEGRYYGRSMSYPSVVGSEGIGRPVREGRAEAGPRLYTGRSATGTLADRFCADDVYELPDGDDDAMAVALGIAGTTAWLAVAWRAALAPDERVLVLGATGAVGLIAVQAARLLGAGRIVAAGRRPAGLERALELGADATVCLDEDDLPGALRDAFGGVGPDVVIDPLWGPPLEAALEAAAPRARVVNLGQSAGETATLSSAVVRGKRLDLLGHATAPVPAEIRADAHRTLLAHARAGRLRVELDLYPLGRVTEAWEALRAGGGHKVVVVP